MQNREETTQIPAATTQEIKIHNLLWEIDLEYRYQLARSSFIDFINKLLIVLIFMFSIIGLLGYYSKLTSFISLLGSFILLIFEIDKTYLKHVELKNSLAILLTKAESIFNESFNESEYNKIKNEFDKIMSKMDEPYRILEALCYNEMLLQKRYEKNNFITIPKWKIFFKHIFRFSSFGLCNKNK